MRRMFVKKLVQSELKFEDNCLYRATNRAIRALIADGVTKEETRSLRSAGEIHLMASGFRYYKREAARVINLGEVYSTE